MAKRFLALMLIVVVALLAAACSGGGDVNTDNEVSSPPEAIGGTEDASDAPGIGGGSVLEAAPPSEELPPEDAPSEEADGPGYLPLDRETIQFGGIDWIVLEEEEGRTLVISEKIVTFWPYSGEFAEIAWESCILREWLNEAFYDETFTAEEKARIAERNIENSANPWFDTEGGADTADKVFLLSIEEVVRYFGDSGELSARFDDDVWRIEDEYNTARIAAYDGNEGTMLWWWWLRSPGSNGFYAATVNINGSVDVSGVYAGSGGGGVRPAIWLNS